MEAVSTDGRQIGDHQGVPGHLSEHICSGDAAESRYLRSGPQVNLLFERNRILKKELLWALRDYSFAQARLDNEEYADGMLRGCEVRRLMMMRMDTGMWYMPT